MPAGYPRLCEVGGGEQQANYPGITHCYAPEGARGVSRVQELSVSEREALGGSGR